MIESIGPTPGIAEDGVCIIEVIFDENGGCFDYRHVEVNTTFEAQTGLVDGVGKRMRELFPAMEDYWPRLYGNVARTGVAVKQEHFFGGLNRWFEVYATRIGGEGSNRVAVIFNDRTLRRQSEQKLKFLDDLAFRLRDQTREEKLIEISTEMLGNFLGADRCYFVECHPQADRVVVSRNWIRDDSPSLAGPYPLHDFGGMEWWRKYSAGDFAVENVEQDVLTSDKSANYLALGISSYAVQPSKRDEERTVVLGVTSKSPRKWKPTELEVIDDVVARVWPMVEQARAEAQVRATETNYREMLGRLPVACYILDAGGRVTFFNGAAAALWGRQPEIGKDSWSGSYAMHTLDGMPMPLDRCPAAVALRSQKPVRGIEAFVERPDGSRRHVIPHPDPLFDADGKCIGLINVVVDVTDLKTAETEMRESARHFQLLSEVVALQVWTANLEGELDFVNRETVEYFGTDDLLGNSWGRFVHPEDIAGALVAWRHSLSTGASYETKFRLRNRDGKYRWFLSRAKSMRDPAGSIVKWIGSNTDVDELKAMQAAAEQASQAKDDFLAALSHELRTPLAPVLMTVAELRVDETLPPEVRAQLGMIERNVALEARLIDDLLDLTRISHGKLRMLLEPCDAHSLIGQAVEIVREEARAKNISLVLNYDAKQSEVIVDPARFQQVVWNILRNAVKFTPKNGTVMVQTSQAKREDGTLWLKVAVTDTGIGIEPSMLETVFRPFDQGSLKGSHRFGGLGLGLAIARAVVDLHGGTIVAQSAGKGRGSTFTVELPRASSPRRGIRGSVEKLISPKETAAVVPVRILLVEDHETTLRTMLMLLQRDGHSVTPATSVEDALSAAAKTAFDIVVSDLGLSDGSGIQLMEELRAAYGLKGIALSGYGMEDDLVRSQEAGFVAHLIKPVQFAELRRVIQRVSTRVD